MGIGIQEWNRKNALINFGINFLGNWQSKRRRVIEEIDIILARRKIALIVTEQADINTLMAEAVPNGKIAINVKVQAKPATRKATIGQ